MDGVIPLLNKKTERWRSTGTGKNTSNITVYSVPKEVFEIEVDKNQITMEKEDKKSVSSSNYETKNNTTDEKSAKLEIGRMPGSGHNG